MKAKNRLKGNSRLRSFRNFLRTGHCAPTVMRTMLEVWGEQDKRMMLPASGLPGGIGLTKAECGAVTSAIMALGMLYGDERGNDHLPKVISIGQRYVSRFKQVNGSVNCGEISNSPADMRPCVKAMCSATGMLIELIAESTENRAPGMDREKAEACKGLLQLFSDGGFHCCHRVLRQLSPVLRIDEELLRASWGFLGGTVLEGLTCSALTGGVIAIGLKCGGIENSYLRVARMAALMIAGSDAVLQDHINKANRAMRISNTLARQFKRQFGSTRCREIIRTDCSTPDGVETYRSGKIIDRCRNLTDYVAERVGSIIDEL